MKLAALNHPKTHDLAARLKVSRPTAIGHLELLWGFTAEHAPQGNVGKWPDGSIARACDWLGDPETFTSALTSAGFLDASSEHRLVVHDWPDHAPGWVRAKLHKAELPFITSEPSSGPTSEGSSEPPSEATSGASPRARVSTPRHATPRHASFHPGGPSVRRRANGAPKLEPAELAALKATYPKRAGDPKWHEAERAIHARLAEGHTWFEFAEGVHRYAEYIRATGKERSQYVKTAAAFFGPGKPFLDPWELPPTKAQVAQDSNVSAADEWLRRSSAGSA